MKKLRKLLAMMLTVVMCVSTVSETGFAVFAADDEAEEIMTEDAAAEEVAEEAEDVSFEDAEAEIEALIAECTADEDAGEEDLDGAVPTSLELCVSGNMVDLTLKKNSMGAIKQGSQSGYYFYANGTLLLLNVPIHDQGLNKAAIGIDCTGDLRLIIGGKCGVILSGKSSTECIGIKVNGNLTIEDATEDNITAVIPEKMMSNKTFARLIVALMDGGASLTVKAAAESKCGGAGIACSGNLDIIDNGSLNLSEIRKIERIPKAFAVNATGTANTAGDKEGASMGIMVQNINITGAAVTACGQDSKSISYGIYCHSGKLTVDSGSLEAKSGACGQAAGSDDSTKSAAVYAGNDINIGAYAKVDAEVSGTDPFVHAGIWSYNGIVDIKGTVNAKASGSTNANYAIVSTRNEGGIIRYNSTDKPTGKYIAVPNDGYVGKKTDADKRVTILTADKEIASEVKIMNGQNYDLWVGGVRVNDLNKADISDAVTGGTASFTPATAEGGVGTLTFTGVTGFTGAKSSNVIQSWIPLKICGDAVMDIPTDGIGIDATNNLFLEGQFTITGNGSVSAIEQWGSDSILTIDGKDTELTVKGTYDPAKGWSGLVSDGNIVIKDGTFAISGGKSAITLLNTGIGANSGKIELQGGHFKLAGSEYAIYAYKYGEIVISENMRCNKPTEGYEGHKYTIADGLGMTLVKKGTEEVIRDLELAPAYIKLDVTQSDAVYGSAVADPVYTKPAEDVTVTVSYNGTLKDGSVYESSAKPVKVGDYRVTVEAKNDTDVWRGTADFKITEKAVTATVKAVDRVYAEGNKAVELSDNAANQTITGLVEGDDVTLDLSSATAEMADDNSGTGKAVTVSGVKLAGKDSANYTLTAQPTGVTVNIEKAEWVEKPLHVKAEIGKIGSIQIVEMRAPGASFGEAVVTEGADQFVVAPHMSGTILDWEVKADISKVLAKVTIPVTGATNYKDYNAEVVLSSDEVFRVYFNLGGHGKSFIDAQDIISGNCVVKPEDPVDDDYNFRGWYTESEFTNRYNFSTPVTESFTLYAKWTAKGAPGSSHSALDTWPEIDASTTDIWLVKGQKFYIGTDWTIDKSVKKYATISKKGQFTAKKETLESVPVEIKKGEQTIKVHISKPVAEKKVTLEIVSANEAVSKAFPLTKDENLNVYYYSASPDVATVDAATGEITAVAKGTAKVTAYINGKAYNCSVVVKEKVNAQERTLHLANGKSKSINIKGLKNPEWVPDKEGIVEIKKSKITAKAYGEVLLTAVSGDTTYKVTVYVDDLTLTGEKLTPGKPDKYTMELNANEETAVNFSAVLDQPMIFKCSKPDVAFIDEDGNVAARSAGKCKFTAKVNGKTVTIDVKVK